jgi:hypothetical protein
MARVTVEDEPAEEAGHAEDAGLPSGRGTSPGSTSPGGTSSGGTSPGGTSSGDTSPGSTSPGSTSPNRPPTSAGPSRTPSADLAPDGVVFPLVGGHRSTSATGRAVVADSVRPVDPALADQVMAQRDWRVSYLDAFRRMTALAVTAPDGAQRISATGLAAVHERFMIRRVGEDLPIEEAMARSSGDRAPALPALHTVTVRGTQRAAPDLLSVPYRGGRLVAGDLDRQLDLWVDAGTTEPSFATAVRSVMVHPEWLDLRDVTVVLLGAGAEMGPFVSLVQWGAHVVAVDLPAFDVWHRLINQVRASSGSMSVPVSRWLPGSVSDDELASAAGVDVIRQAPELLAWLAEVEGPITLGNYVYADGAVHVQASVAVDAVTQGLVGIRDDVSLAFLATPTDVFPVPLDVVEDSRRRYESRTISRRIGGIGSAGRLFARNYAELLTMPDGTQVGLNDSLVAQQGPNYALAKRIQRWRALHERSNGRLVSLNVAPATRTRSVVRNRVLAAAYAGAHRFGVEVFEPSTSNTLMAALLVHDLRNPLAAANPANPLAHPTELFWQGANHGGLWRNAFSPRSVLGLAVVLGMVQRDA